MKTAKFLKGILFFFTAFLAFVGLLSIIILTYMNYVSGTPENIMSRVENPKILSLWKGCPVEEEQVSAFTPNTNEELLSWLQANVPETMSFKHKDFDKKFLANRKYFTSSGWCSFVIAIVESRILEAVSELELDAQLIVRGENKIVQTPMVGDNALWVTETPVTLKFTSTAQARVPSEMIGVLNLTLLQTQEDFKIKTYRFVPSSIAK